MLRIYNSLTKRKEELQPIEENKIGIYVCGNTVYDYSHIGHARIFVFFDVVVRYLRFLGFNVTYVRNITDIDDKIIQRAAENSEEIGALTSRFIDYMHEDERALQVLAPDFEPKATEHIEDIINMVATLVKKGYAYVAENGDVYFDVNKFQNYGQLAHQDLAELRSGARVEVSSYKHDPLDFVLWKMSKPGEPAWDSPWGKGRPGWHIECSAMSTRYLGAHFDIHGGGNDLEFPHHQNEVAQAEAANGCKFVNTWMHVGMVQLDKQKMSKSLGNFFTTRDVLKQYDAEILRYFIIASHYRSPLNYSTDNLQSAHAALRRFYLALRDLPDATAETESVFVERFCRAMDDDFNTPEALAVLFDLAREINRYRDDGEINKAAVLGAQLKWLGRVLGILQLNSDEFLRLGADQDETKKIEQLIKEREQARKDKNWQRADELRAELAKMGVLLEDKPEGTIWRKG